MGVTLGDFIILQLADRWWCLLTDQWSLTAVFFVCGVEPRPDQLSDCLLTAVICPDLNKLFRNILNTWVAPIFNQNNIYIHLVLHFTNSSGITATGNISLELLKQNQNTKYLLGQGQSQGHGQNRNTLENANPGSAGNLSQISEGSSSGSSQLTHRTDGSKSIKGECWCCDLIWIKHHTSCVCPVPRATSNYYRPI